MFFNGKNKDSDNSTVEEAKVEAEQMNEEDIQQHDKHYSDKKLWNKIQKIAQKAGVSVVYAVLILYYTLQKPEVPTKVKAIITGALGYFILPLDLIPDAMLGAGYVDDLSVLAGALIQVAMYIDEDMKSKAKDKLSEWFGENVDTSEIDEKLG